MEEDLAHGAISVWFQHLIKLDLWPLQVQDRVDTMGLLWILIKEIHIWSTIRDLLGLMQESPRLLQLQICRNIGPNNMTFQSKETRLCNKFIMELEVELPIQRSTILLEVLVLMWLKMQKKHSKNDHHLLLLYFKLINYFFSNTSN